MDDEEAGVSAVKEPFLGSNNDIKRQQYKNDKKRQETLAKVENCKKKSIPK
jgi:hypothetical protein